MSTGLTLLQIVQTACRELGLTPPATVVNSTDQQTQQLLALLNRDGNDLYQSKSEGWTCLQGEHIINLETPIQTTGNVTAGTTFITNIPSTAGITAEYYAVDAVGQPSAQRVVEVVDATTVRLEMRSTDSGINTPVTFARDTYELPSDFDHYITNTWWDRTNHWMLIGPQSPQMDQWQRSGIVTTGPRIRWRQIGVRPTVWRVWPPPTATTVPDALVFEYVSDGWVQHPNGTYGVRFTNDDDMSLLDDNALILGVKWRMWAIKGFSYAAMQQEYIDYTNRYRARDGGIPDLSMTRRAYPYLITSANVQDGNFPGN